MLRLPRWTTQLDSVGCYRPFEKSLFCTYFSALYCGTFNEFTKWLIVSHQLRRIVGPITKRKGTSALIVSSSFMYVYKRAQETASSTSTESGPISNLCFRMSSDVCLLGLLLLQLTLWCIFMLRSLSSLAVGILQIGLRLLIIVFFCSVVYGIVCNYARKVSGYG
jgi:hypothetical protein